MITQNRIFLSRKKRQKHAGLFEEKSNGRIKCFFSHGIPMTVSSFQNLFELLQNKFWKVFGVSCQRCLLLSGSAFVDFFWECLQNGFCKIWRASSSFTSLKRLEFDTLLKKKNIKSDPSRLVGVFLKGLLSHFLRQSAKWWGFTKLKSFLIKVITLAPNIVIAMLIVLFAVQMGNTASSLTRNFLRVGDKNAREIVATVVAKYYFCFWHSHCSISSWYCTRTCADHFTALVAMIALAGGLAFGLGGKDFVREMLEEMRKGK